MFPQFETRWSHQQAGESCTEMLCKSIFVCCAFKSINNRKWRRLTDGNVWRWKQPLYFCVSLIVSSFNEIYWFVLTGVFAPEEFQFFWNGLISAELLTSWTSLTHLRPIQTRHNHWATAFPQRYNIFYLCGNTVVHFNIIFPLVWMVLKWAFFAWAFSRLTSANQS